MLHCACDNFISLVDQRERVLPRGGRRRGRAMTRPARVIAKLSGKRDRAGTALWRVVAGRAATHRRGNPAFKRGISQVLDRGSAGPNRFASPSSFWGLSATGWGLIGVCLKSVAIGSHHPLNFLPLSILGEEGSAKCSEAGRAHKGRFFSPWEL